MDNQLLTKVKEIVERIIGQDETFVHDRQTTECSCHKEEQLFKAVSQRNKVRADMRVRLSEELLRL